VKLKLALACSKAAGGYGVTCAMQARRKGMQSSEADLMGVDPVTGKGHWYAVTNTGETHDHVVDWQGDKSFLLHLLHLSTSFTSSSPHTTDAR